MEPTAVDRSPEQISFVKLLNTALEGLVRLTSGGCRGTVGQNTQCVDVVSHQWRNENPYYDQRHSSSFTCLDGECNPASRTTEEDVSLMCPVQYEKAIGTFGEGTIDDEVAESTVPQEHMRSREWYEKRTSQHMPSHGLPDVRDPSVDLGWASVACALDTLYHAYPEIREHNNIFPIDSHSYMINGRRVCLVVQRGKSTSSEGNLPLVVCRDSFVEQPFLDYIFNTGRNERYDAPPCAKDAESEKGLFDAQGRWSHRDLVEACVWTKDDVPRVSKNLADESRWKAMQMATV